MSETGIQGYIKSRRLVHSEEAVFWRKSCGASRADIASFLECKKSRIKRIEAGEDSYSAAEIDLLSLFFGIGVQLESPLLGLSNEELLGLQMAYTAKRTHGVLGEGTPFVLPPEMNYRTKEKEESPFARNDDWRNPIYISNPHLAFSPDGKLVAYTWLRGEDQDFSVWDTASGECVFRVHEFVGSFCFSPDNRYFAFSPGKDVILVHLIEENRLEFYCVLDPVDDNIYSPELWELINTQGLGDITEIRFTPDSKNLISINETQGSIRLWDISSKQHIKTWPLSAIIEEPSPDDESGGYFEFSISDLAFSPDGRFMFIARACSYNKDIYQIQYFPNNKKNPLGKVIRKLDGWVGNNYTAPMHFHCVPSSKKFPMNKKDALLFAFCRDKQEFGIFQIRKTVDGSLFPYPVHFRKTVSGPLFPYPEHAPATLGQKGIDLHQVVGVDTSCVLGLMTIDCTPTLAERYIHPQEARDAYVAHNASRHNPLRRKIWVLENLLNRQPVVLPDCKTAVLSPSGKMLMVWNSEGALTRYNLDLDILYFPETSLDLESKKKQKAMIQRELAQIAAEEAAISKKFDGKEEEEDYRIPGWEPAEPEIVTDGDKTFPRIEDVLHTMIQSLGYTCYSLLPIDGNEDIDRLTRLIEETTKLKYHFVALPDDEEGIDIRGVLGAIQGEPLANGEVTTDAIKRLAQNREYDIVLIDDASKIDQEALQMLCIHHHEIADLIFLTTRDQKTFWSHADDRIANRNEIPVALIYIMENFDPEFLIGAEKARRASLPDDMGTVKCLFCLQPTTIEVNDVVWEENGYPRSVRPHSFECKTCGTKHLMMRQDDNRLQGHGKSSIRYPDEEELAYKFLRQFWKKQAADGRVRHHQRKQYDERTVCCVSEVYEHPRCNFVVIAVWDTNEILDVSVMMEILGMDRDQLLALLPQDRLVKGNDKMGCHHLIINHSGLS